MKKVAVFGDLTALYNVRTSLHKNINYPLLDQSIKDKYNVSSLACAKWYTLFHPENLKQVDFVKMLEGLSWKVQTKRPSEIRRSLDPDCNPHKDYRFDAQIAYDIGESTADDLYTDILVISDSLELLKPLKAATKYIDNLSLAFFEDAMDRRWWRSIEGSGIEFINLSDMMHSSRNKTIPDTVRFT